MNEKIEKLLLYIGTAGAVISAIAYLIIVITLVVGIEASMETSQLLIISILGAAAGFMISSMLRTQGVALAANQEESQKIMKEYFETINKKKAIRKLKTIKFHMWQQTIKDIFTKFITVGLSTFFMVKIFMEGSGDYSLIGLAIANIFMFISFGILALRKAYKYYLEEHLAAVKEITARNKTNEKINNHEGKVGEDFYRYKNDPDGTYGVLKRGDLKEMAAHAEKLKLKDQVGSVLPEGLKNGKL